MLYYSNYSPVVEVVVVATVEVVCIVSVTSLNCISPRWSQLSGFMLGPPAKENLM